DAVEKRRLARAVGADQSEYRAPANLKADLIDRRQTAETFGQRLHLQDAAIVAHVVLASKTASSVVPFVSSSWRTRLGSRPCGRSSMVTTRMRPKIMKLRRVTRSVSPGQPPCGVLSRVSTPSALVTLLVQCGR